MLDGSGAVGCGRRAFDDDLVAGGAAGAVLSDVGNSVADLSGGGLPHLTVVAAGAGDEAVVLQGAGHRFFVRPGADAPDGDAGLLDGHGRGREVGGGDVVVLAVVGEGLAAPEAGEDVEAFIEELGAGLAVRGFAEAAEAGIGRAETDGEGHASTGEDIECGGLAGELPRAHAGDGGDHRAEADALGAHGGGGEGDPGIDAPDGLPDEEAVPAGGLGFLGEIGGDAGVAGGEDESVVHGNSVVCGGLSGCTIAASRAVQQQVPRISAADEEARRCSSR